MPLRSQLPGSSPLPASALARGVTRTLTGARSRLDELRALLEKRFGGEVLLLGSGTQSLQKALGAATALPGLDGPVAIPAYSCYDLVSACVGAGVEVEFYDIDPSSLSPDWDSLDEALSRGARVVVAGNLYGMPLDWDALRARVDAVGGFLIEDAAQGVGSSWDGRAGGTFGDATVLSFGRGKGWTGGGGGALITRDSRLSTLREALESESGPWGIRPLVGSLAHWALGRPGLYGIPRAIPALALGETVYKAPAPVEPMAALSAALVMATASAAEAEVRLRREAAEAWAELLPHGPWDWPVVPLRGSSAYLRFPIVADDDSIRHRLIAAVNRFGAAPGYPRTLPELDQARKIVASPPQRTLKGAETLALRLLTLPTHSRVGDRDRRGALKAFQSTI